MSSFDYIIPYCDLPLTHLRGKEFQTKDTPGLYMDRYEIREDGTLWEQLYDIEDRSDPNANGLAALAGKLHRVNLRWKMCSYIDGEIKFYDYIAREEQPSYWIEMIAEFNSGRLLGDVELSELRIFMPD